MRMIIVADERIYGFVKHSWKLNYNVLIAVSISYTTFCVTDLWTLLFSQQE